MPKRLSKKKAGEQSIEQAAEQPAKNPAAVALGRLGGKKGGPAPRLTGPLAPAYQAASLPANAAALRGAIP